MTVEKAREVIKKADWHMSYIPKDGDSTLQLDGVYTAKELEAFATLMNAGASF